MIAFFTVLEWNQTLYYILCFVINPIVCCGALYFIKPKFIWLAPLASLSVLAIISVVYDPYYVEGILKGYYSTLVFWYRPLFIISVQIISSLLFTGVTHIYIEKCNDIHKRISKWDVLVAAASAAMYFAGYIICYLFFKQGSPMYIYAADWAVRHYFLYVWIASILFAIFKLPCTALITTLGCFAGIVLGENIGQYIIDRNLEKLDILISERASAQVIQSLRSHQGVYIWLLTMLVVVFIGLIADVIIKRKNSVISAKGKNGTKL